jgi:pyridoxal phosphate enzyme (YggS family)
MPVDPARVAAAVAEVRARIARVGAPQPVRLVAVTKGFGADALAAAVAAGCDAIGESYAQELLAKLGGGGFDPTSTEIHFIGHVQRNKVAALSAVVDVWESVDRPELATAIARHRPGATVFVQVNSTGEASKSGCPPERVAGVVDHARGCGLDVAGLMTIGPTDADPDRTRAAFRATRELAGELGLARCSMGMSGDLELAVELGATDVRVGTALFGERPLPRAPMR